MKLKIKSKIELDDYIKFNFYFQRKTLILYVLFSLIIFFINIKNSCSIFFKFFLWFSASGDLLNMFPLINLIAFDEEVVKESKESYESFLLYLLENAEENLKTKLKERLLKKKDIIKKDYLNELNEKKILERQKEHLIELKKKEKEFFNKIKEKNNLLFEKSIKNIDKSQKSKQKITYFINWDKDLKTTKKNSLFFGSVGKK